jgi:heme/copper-type cytochrome/quinol oxidase subunit 1
MKIVAIIVLLIPFVIVGITIFFLFNYLIAHNLRFPVYKTFSSWLFRSWFSLMFGEKRPKLQLKRAKVKDLLRIQS